MFINIKTKKILFGFLGVLLSIVGIFAFLYLASEYLGPIGFILPFTIPFVGLILLLKRPRETLIPVNQGTQKTFHTGRVIGGSIFIGSTLTFIAVWLFIIWAFSQS